MRDVNLIKRTAGKRLMNLVKEIPEVSLSGTLECVKWNHIPIYQNIDGDIDLYWYPFDEDINLLNKSKLVEAVDNGIKYISEESFCDLLEEHLYLVALAKMKGILPQIQKHYPKASIYTNRDTIMITENVMNRAIVTCPKSRLYKTYKINSQYNDIWKDKELLIIKET